MRNIVSRYLKELGISPALSGYRYLVYAVDLVVDLSEECKLLLTCDIYPEIARAYGKSSSSVERAIRHAIGVGSKRANPEKYREIFSYTYSPEKEAPTSAEFIFGLADYIVYKEDDQE